MVSQALVISRASMSFRVARRLGGVAFAGPLIGGVLRPQRSCGSCACLCCVYHCVPSLFNLQHVAMNTDVLKWWKLRDHDKPADPSTGRPEGPPHLARMLRQWLGCPATSAGVERLFSKAGNMHHDLKGSMEDGSLEHGLIATANTERRL